MKKLCAIMFSVFFCMAVASEVHAGFGKVDLNYKGEITYTTRFRVEKQDPDLINQCLANQVFEKGDSVNNMLLGLLEIEASSDPFTVFFRGEAFYDKVFDDSHLYDHEIRSHAAYDADILDLYLEGVYDTLTVRVGRQIVQWGQSIAPIEAVAVNVVSPYDLRKATAPGYTFRDYQVPRAMAYAIYEPVLNLAFEGVYSVDFNPRKGVPVVGSFGSFSDLLGYGTVDIYNGLPVVDNRPREWEDMKEYGLAVRKMFPSLNNFELGLYYYRHFNRSAILNFNWNTFSIEKNYDKIDMFGLSFSQAIDAFNLYIQLGGEIAYRPNDLLQMNDPLLGPAGESLGNWEECETVTWNLSFMRAFSDVLAFTPWTFSSVISGEIYGKINLDYEHEKLFYDNWQNSFWYNISVPFESGDMLDNWIITFNVSFRGALHKRQNSLHTQSFTITGKYGDLWSVMVGYYLKAGKWHESGTAIPDRDEAMFKLTYAF